MSRTPAEPSALMASFYPESRFGGVSNVDYTIAFYVRVNLLLTDQAFVLDVGCGRGRASEDPIRFRRELQTLRGKCARVIGIDVDHEAQTNPLVDEFRLIVGKRWPIESASIDLCLCDNVLEHVADPEQFFAELSRVLKPGGHVCVRTPNRLSYEAMLASLIPNRLHSRVLAKVKKERSREDTFPTLYRCNTRRRLEGMLRKHGFAWHVYGVQAEPNYLQFSRLAYRLGVVYHRLVPGPYRSALLAFGQRMT